jgi:hypothetical protein
MAGLTVLLGASPDPAGYRGYALLDVNDTFIEVHGHAKQGAGFGYSGWPSCTHPRPSSPAARAAATWSRGRAGAKLSRSQCLDDLRRLRIHNLIEGTSHPPRLGHRHRDAHHCSSTKATPASCEPATPRSKAQPARPNSALLNAPTTQPSTTSPKQPDSSPDNDSIRPARSASNWPESPGQPKLAAKPLARPYATCPRSGRRTSPHVLTPRRGLCKTDRALAQFSRSVWRVP